MKKLTTAFSLALACILCLWQVTTAQTTDITEEQWMREMQNEEIKIEQYTASQMNRPLPASVLSAVNLSEDYEHFNKHDQKGLIESAKKDYYRQQYFKLHPEAVKIYNPGRVSADGALDNNTAQKTTNHHTVISCQGGDFETGSFSSYLGFSGIYSADGNCSIIPYTNVTYTSTPLPTTNGFEITNNIQDPIVATLRQTNGGSLHAVRINSPFPCLSPNRGINMLQRSITVSAAGNYQLNFSYALVMENPNHSSSDQPFFLARMLDPAGNEVGTRICRISDAGNPFYQVIDPDTSGLCHPSRAYDAIVWRDWTCASLEFTATSTGTYTVQFFMADCNQGGHFGYAYIDDICAQQCCPKFLIQDCCDLQGGTTPPYYSKDQTVQQVLMSYKNKMDQKYGAGAASKSCCDPCNYPGEEFPIFIIGEDGMMISSADYTISWSHDPGNTSAWSYILPGEETVVTVLGPGNCVWTDTFKITCCEGEVEIIPFCTWDPCKYPNSKFPLKVKDPATGTILTTSAGYTFLWTYNSGASTSTGDAITAAPTEFPVYVQVTDTAGCIFYDTFDIVCCEPVTPKNPYCRPTSTGSILGWDAVPGAAYYNVRIITNDPLCCSGQFGLGYSWKVYNTDTTVSSSIAGCFSWQVAAVCPDSTVSPYTAKACCSSAPVCNPPSSLRCQFIMTPQPGGFYSIQRRLSWVAATGSSVLGTQVEINYSDPACCRAVIGMPPVSFVLLGNSYITPSTTSCFSWRVRTVCRGGLYSSWVNGGCSCKQVIHPVNQAMGNRMATDLPMISNDNIIVSAVPNPASDYIEFGVQLKNASSYPQGQLFVSILDLSGREVKHQQIINDTKIRMDVRDLAAGTYIYAVRINNEVLSTDRVLIIKN